MRNIIFTLLILVLMVGQSFAEHGIKIIEPTDGMVVHPGQEITLRVEAVEQFLVTEGQVMSKIFFEKFTRLPASFAITIPIDATGTIPIIVMAGSTPDKYDSVQINLKVAQTATLQSLHIGQQISKDNIVIYLDWNDNFESGQIATIDTVYGIYSDGIKREIPKEEITYTSSNSSIISIDNKGNYQVYKTGEATVTLSISGINKSLPVVFEKPTGIRPSETIPPKTSVEIIPPPNANGWNNSNITITLSAKDNEGGSGVSEIDYSILGTKVQDINVESDIARIYFSEEGSHELTYFARDREWNTEKDEHSIMLNLDKTLPKVSISTTLNILWPPNNKLVDVTINGEATDSLSGIDSVTFKVTDEYGKVQPEIKGFGSTIKLEASRKGDDSDGRIYTITVIAKDKAGNESSVSTAVIVPHDMDKEKK